MNISFITVSLEIVWDPLSVCIFVCIVDQVCIMDLKNFFIFVQCTWYEAPLAYTQIGIVSG